MTEIDLDEPPRMVECVCDNCLHSVTLLDSKPLPRCPNCRIPLTPDDRPITRERRARA
jgi:hypothetical protein